MQKFFYHFLFLYLLWIPTAMGQVSISEDNSKNPDRQLFENYLSEWTEAFNQKNIEKTCALFASNVVATHQGGVTRDYTSICNGFKKKFSEENKKYQYRFEIQQVYRSERLAAVSVIWYLTIDEPGKKTALQQAETLNILQQDSQGAWQVVQFFSFAGGV